jgi:flagellar basal-body rod protein FlgC
MDLQASTAISASGLRAQNARMKVIAENIANADSTINAAGTGPYQRKMIAFRAEVDKASGAASVKVDRVAADRVTPYRMAFEPGHPLADEQGLVKYPNVDIAIESTDMREATRAYEANLMAIDTARQMMSRSLDLLR